jgi:bacterioferritin-associated ferredoxin
MSRQRRPKKKFICFCNGISEDQIQKAIKDGANTLDEIFDQTTAGVGACGGSCRPDLKLMLEHYKQYAEFPAFSHKRRKN